VMRLENKTWLQAAYTYRCSYAMATPDTETYEYCSEQHFDRVVRADIELGKPGRICNISHVANSDCHMCILFRRCIPEGSSWNNYVLADYSHMYWRTGPRLDFVPEGRCKTLRHLIYARTVPSDGSVNTSICACRMGQNKIRDNLIREWMAFCDENHKDCVGKITARVLDM
jgi:hypothetical protein